MQILIQLSWGGAGDSEFLTSSPVVLALLALQWSISKMCICENHICQDLCPVPGKLRWRSSKGPTCQSMQEMQDMQVRSLGQEDPLEKETATHSSILAWENPMDRGAWQATVNVVTESRTRLGTQALHTVTWKKAKSRIPTLLFRGFCP